MQTEIIENTVVKLLQLASVQLPHDVKVAIRRAYLEETNQTGKIQLEAIIKNIELAEKTNTPICQDTGVITFYVKVGTKAKNVEKIQTALIKATRRATIEGWLRPNAVNPFTHRNTGNNTGRFLPYINWEIVKGNTIEITAFPKGGGSENVSKLRMIMPSEGINGLKRIVVDSVIEAGAMPCPPIILGVAVGGGADIALRTAKAALLRPLNQPNRNPELARLEKELHEAVNSTGIGPMGLGGKSTALGVKIDYAYRHPASYPVAVVFQCWAARRATVRIKPRGEVEYLTHKVDQETPVKW